VTAEPVMPTTTSRLTARPDTSSHSSLVIEPMTWCTPGLSASLA
jgi:hypothetical protein